MYERVCPRRCTKKVRRADNTRFEAGTTLASIIQDERGPTLLVAPEDGPAWQAPAGRVGCWESAHAAIPVSFALPPCFCGEDRQRPAGCAQMAPDTGRAQPPA